MTCSQPPVLHTPYDGSSRPFAVGLRPIDEADWLEPDACLVAHLAEKERLLTERRSDVVRAENGTEAAQLEILELVRGNLRAFHEGTHEVSADSREVRIGDRQTPFDDLAPIVAAARAIQEDLALMRKGEGGYRLAAACLCFPSSWSLPEKFGKTIFGLHDTVPGFNSAPMGRTVDRIFENLKTDQILCRFNWSIYEGPGLYRPEPSISRSLDAAQSLAGLFIRVERQTLRRLPVCGDILFTLKIHHDPLELLRMHADGAAMTARLCDQLRSLDADQLRYKGLTKERDALIRLLEDRI